MGSIRTKRGLAPIGLAIQTRSQAFTGGKLEMASGITKCSCIIILATIQQAMLSQALL